MSNWIPRRRANFVAFCNVWGAILSDEAKVAAYMWMVPMVQVLLDKLQIFMDANAAFTDADTTKNRHVMNKAWKDVESEMVSFAKTSIRDNPYMTAADREDMGIKAPDTVPTAHPRPEAIPFVVVETTPYHYQHHVAVQCKGVRKGGKPEKVRGVRVAWQVGGERPALGADLKKSQFSRRPQLTVTHTELDKAKIAYYAACYENAKGEAGPWSPVEEAVIG